MKKFFYSIAVALVAMFSLTGCDKNPSDMIIGTFHVSEISSDQPMDEETRAIWNTAMEDLKNNTKLQLFKDKTFISTQNNVTSHGTWELLADGKQLVLESEGLATIKSEVKDLTDDGFTLIQPADGSTTLITYTKEK